MPAGDRVDAGFRLVYARQNWRHFVETGELGRTLVRMCLLAEPLFPLSFMLGSILPEEVCIRLVVNGDTEAARVPVALADEPAVDAFEVVVATLNGLLDRQGIGERFAIGTAAARGRADSIGGSSWPHPKARARQHRPRSGGPRWSSPPSGGSTSTRAIRSCWPSTWSGWRCWRGSDH